ncbi:MAG: energy-coupling factor transporter transmembrane protein EcfT [Chloroflexi bacterium AL-W]|nr:energy-coupling factor transporter transmembrane protein EcfT [Chloroflexi bacterium AL-N1]NOK67698.1 energy-coupling factor transporter transmembrane protein EcfT [Chloroflexi bacterium AL-N10]NOK75532.1 energy-coupling factor transporter transmembrane protein EcfT [Chloroflexi bacterium AL-N5]NOK82320.1 energy-coupling factor transporter transmembrane protein EcfT [Chloroflexi bacterium AL-W]NOK90165.1 energy-coupling factor transporter transmembrane protein EcfT [Chloroflexi bacterium AL-
MQSLYRPETNALQRLHPLTKLMAAVLIVVATYVITWVWLSIILVILLLLIAALNGLFKRLIQVVRNIVLPVIISLFLIQGILFPPINATPLPLGPITLTYEGLLFALVVSTRLLVLTTTMILVLQTTPPADLVFALTERGLSRSIGYIILVALQIMPDMSARAKGILDTQRSRGLEFSTPLQRVRALVPLIGPLVTGALLDVEGRAMALESRAYTVRGPKTHLRQLIDTRIQRIARYGMLLGLIALIVGRQLEML